MPKSFRSQNSLSQGSSRRQALLVCTLAFFTRVLVGTPSIASNQLRKPLMISMLNPKDLTVFVAGATSGFGPAICRRFHDAGSKVVGAGRHKEHLGALKKQLGERRHVVVVATNIDRYSSIPCVRPCPNGGAQRRPRRPKRIGWRRRPVPGRQRVRGNEGILETVCFQSQLRSLCTVDARWSTLDRQKVCRCKKKNIPQ